MSRLNALHQLTFVFLTLSTHIMLVHAFSMLQPQKCTTTRSNFATRTPFTASTRISLAYTVPERVFSNDSKDNEEKRKHIAASTTATELWLDLRGTSLLPYAALLHLMDTTSAEANKVLVSREGAKNAMKNMKDAFENQVRVCYVDHHDGGSIKSVLDHDHEASLSNGGVEGISLGKTVTLEEGALPDLIPVLDVISNGGWMVLDSDHVKDEDLRIEGVADFVELISAASMGSILLDADDNEGKYGGTTSIFSETSELGGIAISCKSQADIMRASSLIQSFSSTKRGERLRWTESGILLLPSVKNNVSLDKHVASNANITKPSNFIKYAVVIPFDSTLWRFASYMLGDHSENSTSLH